MRTINHDVDLCVVGGGLSGLCAAVAAARHGARVVLIGDRPMLGGNASSEVRMHVCGAHGKNRRETGIIEEIELDNIARNPAASWSIWDSILYEKARLEPNVTLLLNASVIGRDLARGARAAVL
ncbi:MAG: FAD-dependent oxidoreductase [Armatimonadetes bacterium]|nr:FAD-dependent oxidoreductase [Armatimonadota bacterium]